MAIGTKHLGGRGTTNFHDQDFYCREGNTALAAKGYPVKNLRLIERFTRIAPGKVESTTTFDDSTLWTRPWTYSVPMTENDKELILEYACHEGNYGLANILTGGRVADE